MRGSLTTFGGLLFIAGLVCALFAPGGWLNSREKNTAKLDTPLGSIGVSTEMKKESAWPKIGYGLAIAGVVLLVAGAASRPAAR
jgi:hypothetical protein